VAILALAAAIRAVPLVAVLANGGSPIIGDEGNYVEAAQALAHGLGIPDRWLWIRPPAYIVFIAGVFRLSNDSLVALQVAQIAVSLLTIAATYGLVLTAFPPGALGRVNPRHVALGAALILAVQPSLVLYTGFFLTETLFLLLLTALIWALVAYFRATTPRGAVGYAALAGALAGLALLTRASMTPLLVLVAGAILVRRGLPRRPRLAAAGAFVVCILLVLAPWTVRNALHYGRFLPLDTSGYYVIWTDNTDLSLPELRQELYNLPNPADRGNYALAHAVSWMIAHPAEFVQRSSQRMIDSLAPDDFTELGYQLREKLPGHDCDERDVFSFLAWWGWVVLFGGALAGWLLAPRNALWWLTAGTVAVYVLTGALTHNEFRYRYQLFSVLAVFAALAALTAWAGLRDAATGRWRPGRAALLAGGACLLWIAATLPTFVPGMSRALEANAAMAQAAQAATAGDFATAIAQYTTAAGLERTCAAVRRDLGQVQVRAGQPEAAVAAWRDALKQEPGDWRTRALLADLLHGLGRPDESGEVARAVPPTFNAIFLDWAWTQFGPAPTTLAPGRDDIGFVRGFQIGELDADSTPFRWAGPGAQSSIRLRGGQPQGARLTLMLGSLPPPAPQPPTRPVAVAVNGQPLTTWQVGPGVNSYTLDLPAALTAGHADLVIAFDSPTQQASPTDPRFLSFALHSATIAAAAGP
jgi:4-amino-4-deoxy-L-arabinose transferase-like glycosyltransferase